MRPIYIIFAVAVTGVYSGESYNYPPPSQPLEAGTNSFPSINSLPLSQGYNYPSPGSASEGLRAAVPFPNKGFDASAFGSSASSAFLPGSSGGPSFGGQQLGSSSSFLPTSNLGGPSFGGQQGYSYDGPSSSSNNHLTGLPAQRDPSTFESIQNTNFLNPQRNFGAPSEQVNKHVYVYVAPPEQHVAETKQVYVPSPVVNHKIIFIKAPQQSVAKSQVIPLPSKTEEKTLVYVLVKKPEEQEINVQPLPQQHASKPEVYFIKYNTKKDHDAQGFPSGPLPGVLPPGGLPSVEDNFKRGNGHDGLTSQSRVQPSPIYGPTH